MDGQFRVGYVRGSGQIFLENTRLNQAKQWFFDDEEALAVANALLEARNRAMQPESTTYVYIATI